MAGIALICRDMGYQVSGMDQNVYPPMDALLENVGIEIINGYAEKDLPAADIYIVGNVIRRGIPAIELILKEKRHYASAPQWLADNLLKKRKIIAVSGTHGKTTTTALLTKMFVEGGKDVGYLIAGAAKDFPVPARLGTAEEFIIEADEYDTAFFDKRSKFVHYRPDILLINNLEYDHADIFPDFQAIETQFCHLLRTMPSTAQVLYPCENESILKCLHQEPHSNYQQVLGIYATAEAATAAKDANISSGPSRDSNVNPSPDAGWSAIHDGSQLKISNGATDIDISWDLPGNHNAMNLLFASAAATIGGVSSTAIATAAREFRGVERRLENIGEIKGAEIISDFAHHPTAIRETVDALKNTDKFSKLKMLAVVELASNSMRLGVHGDKVLAATANADEVFWFSPNELSWPDNLLQKYVSKDRGIYTDSDNLARDLLALASKDAVILLMSNSSLGGLLSKLGIS